MMRNLFVFLFFVCLTYGVGTYLQSDHANADISPFPAPNFTAKKAVDWINSQPLDSSVFQGKVTLIDIWTYSCWNCYRSFPWLNETEERYKPQGFQVIGIHSPEFEHEKEKQAVVDKANHFGLRHPIMLDNDFQYWRALKNQYWPTYYLVDKRGIIRHRFIGETHANTKKAREIEFSIQTLLEQP